MCALFKVIARENKIKDRNRKILLAIEGRWFTFYKNFFTRLREDLSKNILWKYYLKFENGSSNFLLAFRLIKIKEDNGKNLSTSFPIKEQWFVIKIFTNKENLYSLKTSSRCTRKEKRGITSKNIMNKISFVFRVQIHLLFLPFSF